MRPVRVGLRKRNPVPADQLFLDDERGPLPAAAGVAEVMVVVQGDGRVDEVLMEPPVCDAVTDRNGRIDPDEEGPFFMKGISPFGSDVRMLVAVVPGLADAKRKNVSQGIGLAGRRC